jgi:putative heme-binding domain-containing protein
LAEVVATLEARGRMPMPPSWPEIYRGLSESPDEAVRDMALRITVAFGDKAAFPALRKIVADRKTKVESRQEALATLLSAQDPELPPLLYGLLDDELLRKTAILGLARFDSAETPAKLLAAYGKLSREERDAAIATLASRKPFAHALVDAVEQTQVPREDLSAFTVGGIVRLGDEALTAKLSRVWGAIRTTPEDKRQRIDELKQLLDPKSLAAADSRHGRELYNKTCAKCHTLFGEGGRIGPDITGANRGSIDYLLENMVDPSAVVGKDYQMTTIVTAQGRVINGLLKDENSDAVSLQTVDEVVVVPAGDIDERKLSPLSLMPDGQLDTLTEGDIRSLVAYLASSRQVPLPGEGPLFDEKAGRVLGAIEGESLKIVEKTAGNAAPQKMGNFPLDRWSNQEHLWWTGAKPGAKLSLEFTASDFGPQELFIVMTKAVDYGIVKLALDDVPLGEFDLYNDGVITTGVVSLGTRDLKAGKHRLTVEIAGANPQAVKAYMFGLDYLYLAKKRPPSQ